MDSKTIFARTSKGEDEIRSKTAHLSGDIRRSLLMVDGIATFEEINKRAAPSLRSSLEELFTELIRDGFIHEKSHTGDISRKGAPSGMVSKMIVPSRKGSAPKISEDDAEGNDLDFASEYQSTARDEEQGGRDEDKEESKAEAIAHTLAKEKEVRESGERSRARAEAQARAKAEVKARQLAESKRSHDTEGESTDSIEVQARALQEARERAETKARQKSGSQSPSFGEETAKQEEDELAILEAEAKAKRDAEAKARAELIAQERALQAARARVEAEAKSRREAEAKARAEAEAKVRAEAEAKARREAEEKARREAEKIARAKAEAKARAEEEERARRAAEVEANLQQDSVQAGPDSEHSQARSTSATVLFLDVIGYTKQPVNKQVEIKTQFNRVVSDCLKELGKSERIILDTGDGAAIGFLQHPEDALKVAMQFRDTVTANQHNDHPDLKVRMGIHLGPISIVKDINDLSNMVGDGINDAQRIMSFAGADQVFISRPYYDFISRLSSEYASLFHYQGALQDKHGREHPAYKLVAAAVSSSEGSLLPVDSDAMEVSLEPFSLTIPGETESPSIAEKRSGLGLQKDDVALMNDIGKFVQPEERKKSSDERRSDQVRTPKTDPAAQHSPKTAQSSETVKPERRAAHIDAEEHKPTAHETRILEEAQAKVWTEAEQRAKETSKAKFAWDTDLSPEPQPVVKKATHVARVKRKPLPWLQLGAGIIVVALLVLFATPYVIPTKEYIPGIQKMLSGKLHQPVYIGRLEGRLLPTPHLELVDVAIGSNKQIKAKLARIDFSIPALFTVVKAIDNLELEGVEVDAAALVQASELLQQTAADIDYPISRVLLKEGKLESEGFELSGVGGELSFNQAGKFSRAKFQAEGNKYEWELESAPLYKTRVSITVHDSSLPLLPDWKFDNLTAKGEIAGNELVISELDGHIMGGILHGDARLGWRSGWQAQGSLAAKTITVQNALKVLSGDMDGKAHFQMQAESFTTLADDTKLDGSFVIKNGVINGIDIAETARLHRTENMPGGRTHFDEFSGDLSFDKGAYAFRQLKLSAGVLAANGTLDYSGQQIAGTITAKLDFHEEVGPVLLVLGGTRDNPTLVAK